MTTIRFKLRRGLAAKWTTDNPILAAGEPGLETDTDKFKIGDGYTVWNSLPYFVNVAATAALIQAAIDNAVLDGVPGDSAYTIAVNNGFVGNQTAWLLSLKGTDGTNGTNGTNGSNGSNGNSVTVTLVAAVDWPPASDSNPLHLYFRVP